MQRITTAQITVTKSTGNSPVINMPPVTFFKMLKLSYDRFQLDKCSLIFTASHSTDLLHPCLIYLTCVGMQPRALSPPLPPGIPSALLYQYTWVSISDCSFTIKNTPTQYSTIACCLGNPNAWVLADYRRMRLALFTPQRVCYVNVR